jgi:hypothetical protein
VAGHCAPHLSCAASRRHSARPHAAQYGAISTAISIGVALSNAISGVLVHYAGFHGAFLTLSAIAGLAGL